MSGSFFVEDGYNSETVANLVGPTGLTGATGATGPAGIQGDPGPQGIQGIQGIQGNTGPQGPDGAVGATGPQGIQGIQGDVGPQGPAGNTGPQGPAGAVGPTGAAGPVGATGAVGPAGTAVPWAATTITVPGDLRGRNEHRQTITAASVTPSSIISIQLAPHLDTDENDLEMLDLATLAAVPGTGSFDVVATFHGPQSGVIKLNYQVN